jgi:dimethylaniline monooxygenase (N-oxide forming)
MHSSKYQSRDRFNGLRVAVIGNSLSGVELCADLCKGEVAEVIHFVRRPSIVLPRYLSHDEASDKVPWDLVMYRRQSENSALKVQPEVSPSVSPNTLRNLYLSQFIDQTVLETLSVRPEEDIFYPVAISDEYTLYVQEQKITIRAAHAIDLIEEEGIRLSNGELLNVDAIIYCTGYRFDLPFFDQKMKAAIGFNRENLLHPILMYKSMFSENLPGFGGVGLYKGPYWGTMELQSRFLAEFFSGSIAVTAEEYNREIDAQKAIQMQFGTAQFSYTQYVHYSDIVISGKV